MLVRIGYRYDPETKCNRIRYYLLLRSEVHVHLNENEIVVHADDLPTNFDYKYRECEVIDGKVRWSPTLYHHFHHQKEEE